MLIVSLSHPGLSFIVSRCIYLLFDTKDHAVKTGVILAFCCVRPPRFTAKVAQVFQGRVCCPVSEQPPQRKGLLRSWSLCSRVSESSRAGHRACSGAHSQCARWSLAKVLKLFVLSFSHSRMMVTYWPLDGLLCIQRRRYKFWNKFFEHVGSMVPIAL